MKDKEPFIIILVLFILLGLAYTPIKKAGMSSVISRINDTPPPTGTIASPNSGSSINKSTEGNIQKLAVDVRNLEQNVDKLLDQSKRSPYYGKIRMSSISGIRSTNPNQQYLTLSTNIQKTQTVKITGWYMKSEVTGYYAVIGKAALLPYPSQSGTESNVILQQGDRVYLTKGFSPIGISFRTNKCTGYFEQDRTFYPGLSFNCPLPRDEKLPVFSSDYDRNDECHLIIERLPACSTVDSEFIRALPDTVPPSCINYLRNQINYNTCVALHYSDVNFPGNVYRLYFNKFGPLWRPLHDKIDLIDENGLIVDSVSY